MLFFGGNLPAEASVATLYILDVPSLTWSQGESADPSESRSEMACAVSGDNFIVWGGKKIIS